MQVVESLDLKDISKKGERRDPPDCREKECKSTIPGGHQSRINLPLGNVNAQPSESGRE